MVIDILLDADSSLGSNSGPQGQLEEFTTKSTIQKKQKASKDESEISAPKAKRRKSLKDSQLKIKILELIDQGAKVFNILANFKYLAN